MPALPVRQRKYHAFLSHAHADKGKVDGLFTWLNDVSGVPVWYDDRNLSAGAMIATCLPEAIAECRAMIIVLSKASVASGWVREEYEAGVAQRTQFRDFRIIPLRLEECEVPGFLQTTKWLEMPGTPRDLTFHSQLLADLFHGHDDLDLESGKTRDVYVSRTWRDTEERRLADRVCRLMIEAGFRLIGDARDQEGFDEGRIRSLISSCGGLAAVLPDRGNGATSKYLLQEIGFARALGVTHVVIAEPTVNLPPEIAGGAVRVSNSEEGSEQAIGVLREAVAVLQEEWREPAHPHYVFYGTDFDVEHRQRNELVRRMIQRLTAIPCRIGEQLAGDHVQQDIVNAIGNAHLVIADVSDDNLNTCIEAGIARGAGRDLHLVARGPRRRPPFMFRDKEVTPYEDDLDLLGKLQRIAFRYRRRVLNRELQQ
ncbi:MAG TPA: toll/interleukin-1 receptor domain-containing protein [Burkholderiales bacterium]|nr:toll/interleukin-1 receptor domain-containing protein [Burkholderiales bacterium]